MIRLIVGLGLKGLSLGVPGLILWRVLVSSCFYERRAFIASGCKCLQMTAGIVYTIASFRVPLATIDGRDCLHNYSL